MGFFKRKYYQIYTNLLRVFSSDDVLFTKVQYYQKNNKKLNLDSPIEFMEKIQWLKLYKYTESYGKYVDKYDVREYVEQKIGKKYLVDIIGVYESSEQIDFNALPQKFVLKCTHASGFNVIVKDKNKVDWKDSKKKLSKYLSINYYDECKEKIYKDVQPRILAEHFLDQLDNDDIIDYKFYCFHGEPKYVLVKTFDNGKHRKCFYDLNWNKVEPEKDSSTHLYKDIKKPDNFEEMIQVAKKLSEDFMFMRVDLYSIEDKIYFGELTFFPSGGIRRIYIEKLNYELGEFLKLPFES